MCVPDNLERPVLGLFNDVHTCVMCLHYFRCQRVCSTWTSVTTAQCADSCALVQFMRHMTIFALRMILFYRLSSITQMNHYESRAVRTFGTGEEPQTDKSHPFWCIKGVELTHKIHGLTTSFYPSRIPWACACTLRAPHLTVRSHYGPISPVAQGCREKSHWIVVRQS